MMGHNQESIAYISAGGPDRDLSDADLDALFSDALGRVLAEVGDSGPVLILPPDITRYHSRAGFLTDLASRELGSRLGAVMPALGTHVPLSQEEQRRMFPHTPSDKFLSHDWRHGVEDLGRLEADWVSAITGGAVCYDWPVQVNKLLISGGFSLIISIGQVVPHEVAGMANHSKNIFVGTGGKEGIDKSHFAGAAYGMERIMGRTSTPVRSLFDEGLRRFGSRLPRILWVLTVIGRRSDEEAAAREAPRYSHAVRGLFIGFGRDCFEQAAALSRRVNVDLLDEPIHRALVYLDPGEFHSTWLGNKAVYRTRMAMADGGELLVLAPALERFGEDPEVDALIRKHGYRSSAEIQERLSSDPALAESLSAAAHLIHGSSEGRFTIRYCPGPALSRQEIESLGYAWGDLPEVMAHYKPSALVPGWNTLAGERFFFVPNPALGLWAERQRFQD